MKNIWYALLLFPLILAGAEEKESFKNTIFPLEFMNGKTYTIVENLPAVLWINAWAVDRAAKKEFGNQKPVLILDTPESITLNRACIKTNYYKKLENLPFKTTKMERDGKSYHRFEIPFFYLDTWGSMLGVGQPHSANSFRLFLSAQPGSAGTTGTIFWRIQFGTKTTKEQSHSVAVLPPLKEIPSPARYFELGMTSPGGSDTPFQDLSRPLIDFWTNLSSAAFAYRGPFNALDPYLVKKMRCDYMIGCNKQLIIFALSAMAEENRGWRRKIAAGSVPALVLANGTKSDIAVPAWFLLDDPRKEYETYLAKGAREIRKLYPDCKRIYFNYEPGVDGFDAEGLKRFAAVKKLKSVPTRQEVTTGAYKQMWFEYMIDLHHQMIGKVAKVFRREMPGVEIWLCTDNLHAKGPRVAYWCAVDSIRAEEVVDGHMPMPYYCGKEYFDDLEYSLRKLKKPILPIADPSERDLRFFSRYTPEKIHQNIIATAALGAKGYGFWPDDVLAGAYFRQIHHALGKIAKAEDFYSKGKRTPEKLEIIIKNTRKVEVPDSSGKKVEVTYPDYSEYLRSTVHEHNGELLATLFNYHETMPLFLMIKSGDMPGNSMVSEIGGVYYKQADITKGVLVKLEPSEVKLIRIGRSAETGKTADTKKLEQELLTQLNRFGAGISLKPQEKDGASASWRIPGGSKTPMLMLKNPQGQQILIDAFGKNEILFWHNAAGQGPLGMFLLHDQNRIKAPYQFQLKEILLDKGTASAASDYVFTAQDAGADFEQDGLTIRQTSAIGAPDEFTLTYQISNRGKNPMNAGFRIKNMPFRKCVEVTTGAHKIQPKSIPENKIVLKRGAKTDFLAELPRTEWSGEDIFVKSANRNLRISAPDFDGIYFWSGSGTVSVELLTKDFILSPGEQKTYRITMFFR